MMNARILSLLALSYRFQLFLAATKANGNCEICSLASLLGVNSAVRFCLKYKAWSIV